MSEEEEQQEQADLAAAHADGSPLALKLLDDFLVMEESRKAAAAAKKKKAQPAADLGDQPKGNQKRITSKQSVSEKGAQDVQPESGKKQRKGGAGDESVSARRHTVPDGEKAQHGQAEKDAKGVSARRHTDPDDEETTQTGETRIDDESSRNTYRVRWGKQSKGFKYQPRNKQSKKNALQQAKEFAKSCQNA